MLAKQADEMTSRTGWTGDAGDVSAKQSSLASTRCWTLSSRRRLGMASDLFPVAQRVAGAVQAVLEAWQHARAAGYLAARSAWRHDPQP
jgi:hypothetical protein